MTKYYEDATPFLSVTKIGAWKVKCRQPVNQTTSVGEIGIFGEGTCSEELTEALTDVGFERVTTKRMYRVAHKLWVVQAGQLVERVGVVELCVGVKRDSAACWSRLVDGVDVVLGTDVIDRLGGVTYKRGKVDFGLTRVEMACQAIEQAVKKGVQRWLVIDDCRLYWRGLYSEEALEE
ncbi:hypothetical protein FHG87_008738 [Trinorchestia longiramus]|nr:hypothetical protein FHG87_008738 [Trinorchestia longiramus]